ncbi:MAG: 2-hydroxychromene-2-carboxylate isomerase [Myxococcales bacterium]|nr:2-hydroxychromene-2-carboxylate isomerase [Myxococcales bacterium]
MQFWFDFASTYSYVAALRIEEACASAGVTVEYKPFLLGPIFTEQLGIKDSPFNAFPVRGRYMWRDLERLCEKYDLPWRRPSVFPRNSVLAARVACCAGAAIAPLARAIFKANFAEDQDISDVNVIRALVEGIGGDGAQALELAASADVKAQLRANTNEAQRLGIFGAPDFIAAGELFFGQDRLDDAILWESVRSSSPAS